jgi:predicted nucleotidyltransferase
MRIDAKGTIGEYPHASGADNVARAARPITVGADRFGNGGRIGARKRAADGQGAGIGGAGRSCRTRRLVHHPSRPSILNRNSRQADHSCDSGKGTAQFLDRVEQVNKDPYFLGKVTRLVLFGSMLKPEVERLSDVDLAVELSSKEADMDRARARNYDRVEDLIRRGHRFRNFMEREFCWYWEVFGHLKGRSRVIAVADYAAEKTFVLTVPHRFLIGQPEELKAQSATSTPESTARRRRPRGCPF